MTYCREGHTLIDNEAEAGWEKLVPGTNFELLVNAVTYFGTVDEYSSPTVNDLFCRLYSDPARTILVTTPIPTGLPYEISAFVSFSWRKEDLEGRTDGDMGIWVSPPVVVRDDTGTWVGNWLAEPKTEAEDSEVEFKFEGTHTLFTATVDDPIISEIVGVGIGAGTYQYCIVPVDGASRLGAGSRILTVTLAGPADIFIDWLPNNQVSQWNVYGRQIGGTFGLMATLPGATVSYTDNGVDIPNPAFQPPLFEDPAWTVAVANRSVIVVDGGITSTGDISEDATELTDQGAVIADASDVGGFVLDNATEGLSFNISGLESSVQVTENVVLDPNLFINSPLPPDQQTYTVQYDFHVYDNDAGLRVIEETDSQTGQTKRLTIDQVAGTIFVEIIENDVVIASSTIPLDPAYTIPDVGSMGVTLAYDEVRVLTDGTILGKETLEVNTYIATPIAVPGIGFMSTQNFGTPAFGEIAYTLDSGVSWANYTIPGTRLVAPPGFTTNRQVFLRCHGEGWTVVGLVNHPTVPSLVSDYSLHWTNDLTANPWPFNDASGRVAGLGMSADQFFNLNTQLAPTTSGGPMGTFTMRTFANGLGPVMTRDRDTDDQSQPSGLPGREEMNFFYPATGMYHFQSPGLTKYRHTTYWREKNLLIGLENGAVNNIWTNPIGTVDATPLGAQTFRHGISTTPDQILAIGTTRDIAYVVWKRVATSELGWSWSLDGFTWTDVLINNTNSADYTIPGQEPLGLYPGENSDPQRNGDMMFLRDTTRYSISTDNGATWNFTPAKAASSFNAWEYRPYVSGIFGEIASPKTPMMWDGIAFMADNPNTFLFPGGQVYRMDTDFADLAPNIGGSYSIGSGDTTEDSQVVGTTIGSSGSPNGIPGANLRRYIGRSVVIPIDAAQPAPPFVIRDTSKSEVYDSKGTRKYSTLGGRVDIVIQTTERGGTGNPTYTKVDDGQVILRELPANLPPDSFDAWKNPPLNMRWTSKF